MKTPLRYLVALLLSTLLFSALGGVFMLLLLDTFKHPQKPSSTTLALQMFQAPKPTPPATPSAPRTASSFPTQLPKTPPPTPTEKTDPKPAPAPHSAVSMPKPATAPLAHPQTPNKQDIAKKSRLSPKAPLKPQTPPPRKKTKAAPKKTQKPKPKTASYKKPPSPKKANRSPSPKTKTAKRKTHKNPQTHAKPSGSTKQNTPSRPKASSAIAKSTFLSRVRMRIERNKRYPLIAKKRRLQGNVQISFSITRSGHVRDISLKGSSIFFKSAKEALKKAFPVQTKGVQASFPLRVSLTMYYKIR